MTTNAHGPLLSSLALAGLIALGGCAAVGLGEDRGPPPDTVAQVDLERYQGRWYEIAALPNRFERECIGHTQAMYWPADDDGDLTVLNLCGVAGGGTTGSEGRARVVPGSGGAAMEVTFLRGYDGWIWQFGGDYLVIALDEDYQWAVIGHPTRRYGWVLARDTVLAPATLQGIEQQLQAAGYDACEFAMTPQRGGRGAELPLCVVAGAG